MLAMYAGCTKGESVSEFQPDTNKTGKVTLLASIENADSRASLVATGETRWQPNDAIKVICDDSSTAVFNIDGTGETRRALFTSTLEGKSVGEYALYPSSVEIVGDNISIELPAQITPSPTGTCAFMAGVIDEKNEVLFKQLTAYATVQINKLAPETASIVFTSDKNLSGLHSVTLPEGLETGTAATTGDNSVVITFAGDAPTMINAFFALPVGEYAHLTATAYNAEGKKLNEVVLGTLISAARGLLLDYQIEMPVVVPSKPTPIPGTVNVAGIYWAAGNLEYEKGGQSSNGFADGWRIAPNQAHYYDAALGKERAYTNYDKRDVFNLGGIADPFDCEATSAMNAAAGTSFSGKMYADQACTTETTDFAAAKYGDVAYWASKGQYRMPSTEDIQALIEKASAKMATYTLDGVEIAGIYFYDPDFGEAPTINLAETFALTDADLEVGLFLPYNGRGYNKSGTNKNTGLDNRHDVFNSGSNCIYHVANIKEVDPSTKNYVEGGCYGYTYNPTQAGNAETNGGLNYLNGAMNATARLAIRPVYSGNVPAPSPTPTPTPGVDPKPVDGDWGSETPGGAIDENPYNGEL